MSDWWLLIAAFWFWYFADCIKGSRTARFVFSRSFGRGQVSTAHGNWAFTSISPLGWHAKAEDPPISFSPAGISNVPIGSAGRPTPMPVHPRAWRWEEINRLTERRGRIYLNDEYFCQITPFTRPAMLRELIDGCKNRPSEAREAWLTGRLAGWFRPAHLKRQRAVLVGRSGTLAMLAGVGVFLSLLVSLYLVVVSLLPLSAGKAELIGRLLPWIGWYLLGIHLLLVGTGWQLHRRLLPGRGEARFSLLFNALLLPPQAYRLRARIGAEYFQQAHPLAWLAAGGRQADFVLYAKQAVTDLYWPQTISNWMPERFLLAQEISSWMKVKVGAEIDRLLRARGVEKAELIKKPKPDGASSCAYCPRCDSQFTTAEGRCLHGVPLVRL